MEKDIKTMTVNNAGYNYIGHFRRGMLKVVLTGGCVGCSIYPKDEFNLLKLFAVFGIDTENGNMLHEIIGKSCNVEFNEAGYPVKLYNLENDKIVYDVQKTE